MAHRRTTSRHTWGPHGRPTGPGGPFIIAHSLEWVRDYVLRRPPHRSYVRLTGFNLTRPQGHAHDVLDPKQTAERAAAARSRRSLRSPSRRASGRCAAVREIGFTPRPRAASASSASRARENRRPDAPYSAWLPPAPAEVSPQRPRAQRHRPSWLASGRARSERSAASASDGHAGPEILAQPVMKVGHQIAEAYLIHTRRLARRGARQGLGDDARRAHSRSRARLPSLSASGFRRHGPAHQ